MHVFLENIVPTLVDFWTGCFKGLDVGSESYEIAPHIWERISEETTSAVPFIPAAFVRRIANITNDRSLFTAEAWSFWFMYIHCAYHAEELVPKQEVLQPHAALGHFDA